MIKILRLLILSKDKSWWSNRKNINPNKLAELPQTALDLRDKIKSATAEYSSCSSWLYNVD